MLSCREGFFNFKWLIFVYLSICVLIKYYIIIRIYDFGVIDFKFFVDIYLFV